MKIFALVLFLTFELLASRVDIFVASSAKDAMSEVTSEFKKLHPQSDVRLNFGASGKAYAQFSNGFVYDLFFSADNTYTAKIVSDGGAISEPKVYAKGVIALLVNDKKYLKDKVEALKDSTIKHISIANPKVAPYGAAAIQILKSYGIYDEVREKLVLGENIGQSVQFVDSGAAEAGLVALSLIKNKKPKDSYMVIDGSKFSPLDQSFVITKYAKDKPLAKEFGDFVVSDKAKEIFKKYGFGVE
ncbi:MAG: molybdate ABC transporter substrate-binding protein [Sulfurimonas sp.]